MASSAVFDPAPCWHVRAKPRAARGGAPQGDGPPAARPPVAARIRPRRGRLEDVEKVVRLRRLDTAARPELGSFAAKQFLPIRWRGEVGNGIV
jgi:hypothetical protein